MSSSAHTAKPPSVPHLKFYDIVGIDRQPLYLMFKDGQWLAM